MRSFPVLLMLSSLSTMKGFLQKAKADLKGLTQRDDAGHPGAQSYEHPRDHHNPYWQQQHHPHGPQHSEPRGINEPTPLEIMRYRYHHATNLGSIYVIERWLHPSRFPDGAEGSSELASVKAWVDKIGIEATKQKFEEWWADAVSEEDIQWLVNVAKATTIRLPIGYYDLPWPEFTRGTPFEPYAQVYSGAWHSIRILMSRLRAHSIGVLIDLHALPGGANAQEHSGTNSGRAELWTNSTNRALGVRCCEFLAQDARTGSDIAGIQLVNEAEWDAPGMYEWYDECIAAISNIDSSIPVIISDGWNLDKAIDWSLRKNSVKTSQNPVIIDTHYYWAFTDEDKRKSPQQIIGEVWTKLDQLNGKEGSVVDRGAVQVVVGEYSCVLTEDSWAKSNGIPKEELVKQFGQTQSQRYQQRAGGSYFWTWKMDWMPGGEWGFKAQTDAGNIVPPRLTNFSAEDKDRLVGKARNERDGRMHESVKQHIDYWSRTDHNGHYEHDKYIHGWKVGYRDALSFFEGRGTQGDKIGMLEMWTLKRLRESGYRGGFTWLFEQGLRKGVQDYYDTVGI
jgi:aryl-phospho-beta-D-glucosidase BglC (GH1 family)